MAIANALQLEATRATPALFRFNKDAHAKFEVAQFIHCAAAERSGLIKKKEKKVHG